MSFAELVLNAFPLHQVFLNFFTVAQAERNRPIDLLQAQRRIMRVNSFSGFAMLKRDCELGQRHRAPGHV